MKQVNYVVGGVVAALVASASSASAQQVMWKDNPISGKVVGLTYGTSGWTAAEAQAVAYGGHLVTVRNQSEQDWLVANFSGVWGNGIANGSGPWIGLHEQAGQGSPWVWTSAESTTYLNWWGVEPNNAGGNEVAAHLLPPENQFKWNDAPDQFNVRSLIEVDSRPPRSWSWPLSVGTGTGIYHHSIADLDSDGDLDVAAQDHSHNNVWILVNNGQGQLSVSQQVAVAWPMNSIPFDWGSDGSVDLLVTSACPAGGVFLLRRTASGAFQAQPNPVLAAPNAWGIARADLNSDSRVDVVVACASELRVFLADTSGQLALEPTAVVACGVEYGFPVFGDLDGDGDLDMVRGSPTGFQVLLWGSASSSFVPLPVLGSGGCWRPTLLDFDGDQDLDLVQAREASAEILLWSNSGTGNFAELTVFPSRGRSLVSDTADVDFDGKMDFLVCNRDLNSVDVYLASGSAQFSFSHSMVDCNYPLGVLAADMNGDAKPDIVVTNHLSQDVKVVLNQSLRDCNHNGVDDLVDVFNGTVQDCNGNQRPDSCEALTPANNCNGDAILDACQLTALTDCNNNARLDTCDLASGAPDCNGNQILDVCEPLTAANDCNGNGLLDYCELVAGTAPDCNLNSRPDSCDLAAGLPDCNLNQVPDACDLGAGTSNDGDLNNIPDECSLDCNANGLLDTAECAQGLVADCNGNLVPDSCDLVAGVPDCNTNGVPDSCDVAGGQDCNANGQPDACDLAAGGSDCNGNQQLDSCELAAGGGDCNGNQQFDACELLAGAPDCNGNGALDACDIAAGAADCDGNQVPDACQPLDATSDCNANLILDVCDILGGAPDCNGNGRPDSCDVDTNGDQIPDECQDGGTLYCFGDGAANSTPCPCGGVGAPRSGCPNSVNPAGGYLVATGLPSRIADTLVLRASQMPPVATVLYFQGTSQASTASGTIGTVFGDGLRCAAGAVVRVGFRTNSAGASEIPSGGSPALHIAGQIPATGAVTRYYQGWYRDVNPSFCTANRYNLTNGVAVVWVP